MARRTLQELTIKDNFLFAAVMMNPDNCRGVLERTLGFEIDRVEVSREKCIIYNPEYHGIRLDVYARDGKGTHYNVEIQVIKEDIFKRSRYYHSQMDMEILGTGTGYEELPDTYVIFICDFDPVGLKKYRYTLKKTFCEDETYDYQDGTHTYFLSTKGENDSEVPVPLVKFLKFVGAKLPESMEDYGDCLVSQLQTSIRQIKSDREMGNRYMVFEEMMKREFKDGKIEGRQEDILEILEQFSTVPNSVSDKISNITDLTILKELLKFATKAASLEEFEAKLDELVK